MTAEASSVVEIHDAPRRVTGAYGEDEEYWKKEARDWKKLSIYKVPAYVRDLKTQACQPQVVSLGPYHHDEEHLKPMEKHKARALFYFLKRSGKPLKEFQEALSEVLDNLMDCYDQLDEKWRSNRDAFLQLMILDGAFMLEILSTWTDSSNDYPVNDPIFGHHGELYIMPVVQRDMLMLENQLPMLLLHKLVAVKSDGTEQDVKEFVNKLILKFYFPFTWVMEMGKCLHVLDVFRKRLLFHKGGPSNEIKSWPRQFEPKFIKFHSATELDEAGIQFSKSKTESLEDVSFIWGELRLPVIVVDGASESMFLNLIAFERSHVGAGSEVSSYIYLMSKLLSNERDVALLHSKGIIWNALGRDEEVARLFKYLTKEIRTIPPNKISLILFHTILYCKKPRRKIRAKVVRTYFRSPWNIVNLIGAIFLFVLTVVQTIYTIYK